MRRMKTIAFFAFSLMIYSFALLHAGAYAAPADAARAAIEAQSRRFVAALAAGDAAGAAGFFTEDARLSVPGIDGVLDGRETIGKFWQGVLGGGMKSLILRTRDLEGRGDLRIETGSYAAFGANSLELGRGEYLLVWKRVDGAWKIHRDYGHPGGGGEAAAARPAARADPDAGLPRDYARTLRRVGETRYDEKTDRLSTVYANAPAASTRGFSQEQDPDGSVVVMEFAEPQRDGEGQLLRDARGVPLASGVERIDVMRRVAGFGAVYGEDRAGEWAFSTYRPDGGTVLAPEQARSCAGCHRRAGAAKDYVFRSRRWSTD
jgi:ketosteroid isomerase-like protein